MLIAMAGSFDENFHRDKPPCASVKNFPKGRVWDYILREQPEIAAASGS
jgi:hypothetical protein